MNLYNNELDVSINVNESLIEELVEIGKRYFPKEYGGFLVGYYNETFKTVYITDSVLPIKYENTSTSFKREPDGLEEIFKELYNKTPSQYYIGEWHTHPNGLPYPSIFDKKALNKIAADRSTSIKNPIMLIIGYDAKIASFAFYVSVNDKLYKYE